MIRRLKSGIQRNSGFSLNVMTDDEAHEIHLATLEVLRDTGVFVESEEAIAIYDGAGCIVDPKTKTVKFPAWVVEDAIRAAPATFTACGRRPEDDVILQDNRVTFTNFGEGIMFVDPYTGEYRDTTGCARWTATRFQKLSICVRQLSAAGNNSDDARC